MGVYEGRGSLTKAMKELTNRWQDARGDWRDAVAAEFEDKYIEPLERDLKNALGAMDHVGVLLQKIRHECR